LALAIDAAKKNVQPLREISDACENGAGRYKSGYPFNSGFTHQNLWKIKTFKNARALCEKFAKLEGRQPRS